MPPTQPTQPQLQPITNKSETQNGDIEEFENEMDLAGNKPETIPGNQLRIEPEIIPYKAERFDVDEQQEWTGPMKLVYFAEFRLRAEMSRLILRYAEEPYEDILISRAEWPSYKDCMNTNHFVAISHTECVSFYFTFSHSDGNFASFKNSKRGIVSIYRDSKVPG